MYKILSGSTHQLRDTAAFIELLNNLDAHTPQRRALSEFFSAGRDVFVTRAPGRLDVMGGVADYSGALVLEMPLAVATHVALQREAGQTLKVISLHVDANDAPRLFEMSLCDFLQAGEPIEYATARDRFRHQRQPWAAYIAGAFLVLMRERGEVFKEGARILVSSDVPEGKGVSSSAALEVAVMRAIVAAYELHISARELALLCQRVENLVAGAPCGVMDQMTSACGEAGQLLALLCQPCELKGTISLPAELAVWGIDSGARHTIGGAAYDTVRTAAFMGYRIIADIAGLSVQETEAEGIVRIEDNFWRGYLANITPEEFAHSFARHVPHHITGAEFKRRYKGITDTATQIKPEWNYPVLAATRHPIYEHARVCQFAETLENWRTSDDAGLLGGLMYESHESYSACGLGAEGTDALVALVREVGTQGELYGAKITGGGSGGTVAVLGRRDAGESVSCVAAEYARRTGQPRAVVMSGSSPGADKFGYVKLRKTVQEIARQI